MFLCARRIFFFFYLIEDPTLRLKVFFWFSSCSGIFLFSSADPPALGSPASLFLVPIFTLLRSVPKSSQRSPVAPLSPPLVTLYTAYLKPDPPLLHLCFLSYVSSPSDPIPPLSLPRPPSSFFQQPSLPFFKPCPHTIFCLTPPSAPRRPTLPLPPFAFFFPPYLDLVCERQTAISWNLLKVPPLSVVCFFFLISTLSHRHSAFALYPNPVPFTPFFPPP